MLLPTNQHLTYCTNIHPGETWSATFEALKNHLPNIKTRLSPTKPFGIGLRLSNEASLELIQETNLEAFKKWLIDNHFYVFTMNGFPFGGFHRQIVKDHVHTPDWTTKERLEYTKRLAFILASLPSTVSDLGISTSPISYKYWHKTQVELDAVKHKAAIHFVELITYLVELYTKSGKFIHIDIEPEPDGVIENSDEMISFYNDWLIPEAKKTFSNADQIVKQYIQVCYDVCHFAVGYEQPQDVILKFEKEGIKIGKVQISAALKVQLATSGNRDTIRELLHPFQESTYLHQVVQRNNDQTFTHYADLPDALKNLDDSKAVEWRTHFHVPIYKQSYNAIESTQQDIIDVLKINQTKNFTNHFEVETYTWEVLPTDERVHIEESIVRELEWFLGEI